MEKRRPDLGPLRWSVRPQAGEYLEQRRKAFKKDSAFDLLKKYHYRWTLLILLGSLVIFSSTVPRTYSYFNSQVSSYNNEIQSDKIGNYITVTPGNASATFPAVGNPSGDSRPAAFLDSNGKINIDFGEVPTGNGKVFVDLLRVNNTTSNILNLTWHFKGSITPLFEAQRETIFLLPVGVKDQRDKSNEVNPYHL